MLMKVSCNSSAAGIDEALVAFCCFEDPKPNIYECI